MEGWEGIGDGEKCVRLKAKGSWRAGDVGMEGGRARGMEWWERGRVNCSRLRGRLQGRYGYRDGGHIECQYICAVHKL